MKAIFVDEKEEVCTNCKYYYQHYVKSRYESGYSPCYAGHCTYPRMKDRKPLTPACNYFVQCDEMTKRRNPYE